MSGDEEAAAGAGVWLQEKLPMSQQRPEKTA